MSNLALLEEFDKNSREDLLKVKEEIESGESFSKAVGKHINISDPVILKLILIGEEKGLLSDFCKKIVQRISFSDDISKFFFDLHLLLISGTPILEGLEICGDKFKKNKKLSLAIKQIKNKIIGVSEIYDALAQHSKLFNKELISLIKFGE